MYAVPAYCIDTFHVQFSLKALGSKAKMSDRIRTERRTHVQALRRLALQAIVPSVDRYDASAGLSPK